MAVKKLPLEKEKGKRRGGEKGDAFIFRRGGVTRVEGEKGENALK